MHEDLRLVGVRRAKERGGGQRSSKAQERSRTDIIRFEEHRVGGSSGEHHAACEHGDTTLCE